MSGRHIQSKMVDYLDQKLTGNGLAAHAIAEKDARLLFRLALEACVGIREKTGRNDGPIVELIQQTIGGAERESWCMSLQQTGIAYAELKTGLVSPLPATEHCLTCWEDAPTAQRVKAQPLPGAICIWRHGATSNGHTGCLIEYEMSRLRMSLVEGNTEAGVIKGQVERDGGGCYFTQRSTAGTGDMRVVGFLKPFAA